jgi:DNA-binding transcriptional MerR regulator
VESNNDKQQENEQGAIDIEFKEDNYTRFIRGKAIYFKTAEVAEQLSTPEYPVSDSTVRFWCTQFKEFLPIETVGRNRMFKDGDIEKLRYIKKLLYSDGLSIQQVKEFLQEVPIEEIENKALKQNEPLPMQALASALTLEIGVALEEFKEQIRQELINEIKASHKEQIELQKQNQQEIKETIALTIDEKLDSKFDEKIDKLQSHIDQRELQAKERDQEIIDTLKQEMKERKKLNEQLEQEKSKSWWNKIRGK